MTDYRPTWGDSGPSEEQVNTALYVLRGEYFASVRAMAKDIAKNFSLRDDDLSTVIHDACAECYWTIYNHAAQRAVLCSDCDHESECEDAGLKNPLDGQRAFVCIVHDVGEMLHAHPEWFESAEHNSPGI